MKNRKIHKKTQTAARVENKSENPPVPHPEKVKPAFSQVGAPSDDVGLSVVTQPHQTVG